jgi:hypothetical protein
LGTNFPAWLTDLAPERVGLESFSLGGSEVWAAYGSFQPWSGPFLGMAEDCNKRGGRVIGSEGELSCAEVEITKRLRAAGWSGGWLNSFACGRRRWADYMVSESDLPTDAGDLIAGIRSSLGRRGGVPDVIAWRSSTIAFVESKGPTDSTQKQREWLDAAFARGLDRDRFALFKWSAGSLNPEART